MTSAPDNALVRDAYLAWLISELRLLPVIPIRGADPAARLRVEEVYVPLRVIERAQIEAFQDVTSGKYGPDEENRRRAKALESMERSEGVFRLLSDPQRLPKDVRPLATPLRKLVLIGDAGSGKTTTLHYGALVLADAWRQSDGSRVARALGLYVDPLPTPVYIRLTRAMKWLQETPEGQRARSGADPLLRWIDSQVTGQVEAFLAQYEKMPDEYTLFGPLPPVTAFQAAVARRPLSTLITEGGCLLLLDGLDETGNEDRRLAMQRWIAALAGSYPDNRYLVASRPFKGIRIDGFAERHLSPLNDAEMQQLLANWFGAADRQATERRQTRNVAEEVKYLWEIIEHTPRLFDMCTNPLLLTSVALLVYTGVGLPRERAELYNRLVSLLIEAWRVLQLSGGRLPDSQAERPILFDENVGSVQRRLQQLAAWMQEGQRREATLDQITAELAHDYAEDMDWTIEKARQYVEQLIESLALNSGLIQRRDAGFSFAHYTLQEYLTARHYDQQDDGINLLLIGPNASNPRWRESRWKETILLAVGHWTTSGVTNKARTLLRRLIEYDDVDALLLAAEALDDADASRVPQLAPLRRDVAARLRALAALTDDWRTAAYPNPVLRNRAATMLDRLDADNDRPGLDLTRADYWAERIEPGVFSMGEGWEKFTYTIRRPYALARFPVTNRQYLLFLEALAGRGAPEAVAAANRLKELMKQHRQTPDEFRPRVWPGARYRAGEGNHPVAGVTWYAAAAFAWWVNAWLHDLGALAENEEVRLPTEAEWERAAAYPPVLPGGDPRAVRREYPWGNDWNDGTETPTGGMIGSIRANIDESRIGGTSVVGIFPHGAADCGAQDMAGNVWEWCSTPPVRYPFKGEVAAESLYTVNKRASKTYVLRGGSWYYNRAYARCAFRNLNSPDYAVDHYGFRLARLFSLKPS